MKIKFIKKNDQAVIPQFATEGDAGLDLTATSKSEDMYGNIVYGTGLAMEIPKGYVGLLFPRSSVSKTDLSLANSVGVVDSGYRGEIIAKFRKPNKVYQSDITDYKVGDRVVQLVIIKLTKIEIEEATELEASERGEGGFGSTGA